MMTERLGNMAHTFKTYMYAKNSVNNLCKIYSELEMGF